MARENSDWRRSVSLVPSRLARLAAFAGALALAAGSAVIAPRSADAGDWPQFRGPQAQGRSDDSQIPTEWSASKNVAWKTDLPGPGSSSPIVSGDRVFVTCYTARNENEPGDVTQRHLLCIDANTGNILWKESVAAEQPEDPYEGFLREHGYASNTPVTDGERVYVFYGKSGVLAYGLDGKKLWHKEVGKQSSNRRWGSGSSPILSDKYVIVNASEEGRAIVAFEKATGKQVWKADADTLELAYGTPSIVTLNDGGSELVAVAPGEVWGLNLETGKLRWFAETQLQGNVCPSVLADRDVVYVFGGIRGAGSHAIRAGGRDDVTKSHMVWSSRISSYVATPLLFEGHLYWIDDRGQAFCQKADDGELVYRERVPELSGRGGRPVYASPVLAGGKLYVVSRWKGTFVLPAKPKFEVIARNELGDESDFSGTPAIVGDRMFLRSNERLYCIAEGK